MILFQPASCPHQLYVLTERFVTIVNTFNGTSVTLPSEVFYKLAKEVKNEYQ